MHVRTKIQQAFRSQELRLGLVQIVAQLSFFVCLPFISRGYATEAVRDWTALQSTALLIWSFSQLRTDLILTQISHIRERASVFGFGVALHFVCCCVLYAILYLNWFGLSVHHPLLFAACIFAFGLQQMRCAKATADADWQRLWLLRLVTALCVTIGGVLLSSFLPNTGLLYAWLLGHLMDVSGFPFRYPLGQDMEIARWGKLRDVLAPFRNLMSYGTLNALLSTASDHVFVLLLTAFYAPEITVGYFLGLRLVSAPVSLLNSAVGSIQYVEFQRLHQTGLLTERIVFSFWRRWWPIGVVYYGILGICGAYLLQLLLPLRPSAYVAAAQGIGAAQMHRLLIPMALLGLLQFLGSPVSSVLTVFRRTDIALMISLITIAKLALAYLLMRAGYDLLHIVWIHVAVSALQLVLYHGVQLRLLRYACA